MMNVGDPLADVIFRCLKAISENKNTVAQICSCEGRTNGVTYEAWKTVKDHLQERGLVQGLRNEIGVMVYSLTPRGSEVLKTADEMLNLLPRDARLEGGLA